MRQEELGIREKVPRCQDALVIEPSGKAFDAALGLGAIRALRRDGGQWHTLARYNAADERGEGRQMSRDSACWLTRIIWCLGVPYGTIPAEVVTHRMLLLDGSRFPKSIDDGAIS